MRFLFGIPIAGSSLVELYLVGCIFIAAVLGLGMLISTVAKTQMQAMQMSTFVLLPFVFLSGLRLPDRRHAAGSSRLTLACDPGQLLHRSRARIVLRGAAIGELWQPIAWLSLLHVPHHRPRGDALQEDRGVSVAARTADPAAVRIGPR